jgi:hypothetical protein
MWAKFQVIPSLRLIILIVQNDPRMKGIVTHFTQTGLGMFMFNLTLRMYLYSILKNLSFIIHGRLLNFIFVGLSTSVYFHYMYRHYLSSLGIAVVYSLGFYVSARLVSFPYINITNKLFSWSSKDLGYSCYLYLLQLIYHLIRPYWIH